jgi:ATP-dependent exoDNAse (exonuclease V) beta subunit
MSRDVVLERCARVAGRPGGARFGSLVHEILATAAPDDEGDAVRAIAQSVGRVLGATSVEIEAGSYAVLSALAHPILDRARRAAERGSLRRETPVTMDLGAARLVDGVIDLAFEEDGIWFVVDFKTDDPACVAPEHLSSYRAQVGLYAAALERVTSLPARAVLLFV